MQVCYFCGIGCSNCLSSTICSSCSNSMLLESNSTHRYCTFSCSNGNLNVNNQYCSATCPPPLVSSGSYCAADSNSTTTTIASTLSTNLRFIPFPISIALVVLIVAVVASKIALPLTIVPAALCSFAGIA
jgi:hypothetical protein